MTAQEYAKWAMIHDANIANHHITIIEELARQSGIKITAHFGAELAHTHDALAELAEQIRKL